MKKTTVYVLSLIAALALIGFSIFFLKDQFKGDNVWSSDWSVGVSVEDGIVAHETSLSEFTISKAGDYNFSFSWLPSGYSKKNVTEVPSHELGFVTVLLLFDKSKDLVYATASGAMTADTTLTLSPGTYCAEYHYLTSIEQYEEYAAKYLCGAYSAPYWAREQAGTFASLQKNGNWTMEYSMKVSSLSDASYATSLGMLMGFLLGLCLVFMILALITKGNRLKSPKYDERQEIERGRGFKYAFFCMLIILFALSVFSAGGFFDARDFLVTYSLAMFAGVNVYVLYCIWHEAYFALNQKTTYVIVMFFLIALSNLALTIFSYFDGILIQNGKFGYGVLNLFCTITFFNMFIVMLIKRCVNARSEDSL